MEISEIIKSDKVGLINFFATWCDPCHMMKPQQDQTVEEMGDAINFLRVDIDQDRDVAEEFQIKSIPYYNYSQKWRSYMASVRCLSYLRANQAGKREFVISNDGRQDGFSLVNIHFVRQKAVSLE